MKTQEKLSKKAQKLLSQMGITNVVQIRNKFAIEGKWAFMCHPTCGKATHNEIARFARVKTFPKGKTVRAIHQLQKQGYIITKPY